MTRQRPMAARAAHLALLAGLALLGVAACGGDEGGAGDVATLGPSDSEETEDEPSGSSDGEVTDAEREDAMLEFAECMREHGIDMPDPSAEGGIALHITPETEDEMAAAQEACDPIMEDVRGDAPPLSAEERAEMQDRMLAFARCMRDHGIDMPDPEFSGDGGDFRVRVGGGPGEVGRAPEPDEDFEAAQEACQDELGFEGGPGGGGAIAIRPGGGGDDGPSNDESGADEVDR